jgi:CDP-glucose 4,6-dehydratase
MNRHFECFRGKRVLVTGHTGFKGPWLCEWLLMLGADMWGYALKPPTNPALFDQISLSERINHFTGDVRDKDSLRRVMEDCDPDFIFHLAAQSLVRDSYTEPEETWAVNLTGTVNLLEALRTITHQSNRSESRVLIVVTTDKVYSNKGFNYGYRETDPLGGSDPYSASKAAVELAVSSYRESFFAPEDESHHLLRIATARAGNVIGGGDWSNNRIVPDCMRALALEKTIEVRNPSAIRPWQHVLDALSGYLLLAAELSRADSVGRLEELSSAFNFGPGLDSNRPVSDLVEEVTKSWPGAWQVRNEPNAPRESLKLHLSSDLAHHVLGWRTTWGFSKAVMKTAEWYRAASLGRDARSLTQGQIKEFSDAGFEG